MAKDVRRALMIASEPLKVPSTYASMDPDARAAWKTDQMAREGHGSFSPPGTPEREENFNRWHGNSKIRDGEGNPLRLYHATPKSFDTFIPGGPNPANEMPSGPATWLSPYPDKQPAGHHVGGFEDKFKSGANVMPVHADIRNPLVIDNKSMRDWARQSYAKGSGEFPLLISSESRKMLLEDGYDGILWAGFDATAKDEAFYDDHGIGEHPSKDEEVIALHPPGRAQIKSAIGNRGQYDPEDMHVNYARGGDVRHAVGSPGRQQAFEQWGGSPERWYHGTSKDVDFSKFKIGRHGAWFARDPKDASMYAENNDSQGHKYEGGKFIPTNTRSRVIPVHLKLGKSHTGPLPEGVLGAQNYKKAQSEWFDQLRAQGYDSWTPEGQNVAVILKDPTQIKSAIGNRGTFDPSEADIGKAAGGSATKRALMIARDQRNLLRRIANIYPGPGGGMDPSPGGGGYSGPGGGKYIGPSHYADGGGVDDYGGGHRPPGPDGGAPLHDLTANGTVYPDDVYGPQGARYYGTGDTSMDRQTLKIAHEVRGKPEAQIPIFRAVPKTAGDTINHGDWVTTNPAYARAHGESALRGKYKVIGKTVRADEVYTNGDSLHEYGYWSRAKRATGGPVPPFKLHSGAAKIIGAKGQKKATPQQYAAMPGIKPDELKHSKFDTLGSKALPREEVIKHLEDNAVPFGETQLGGEDTKFGGDPTLTLPGGENYREVLLHTPSERTALAARAKTARAEKDRLVAEYGDNSDPEAAKEIMSRLTPAQKEYHAAMDALREAPDHFTAGHWEQPNVLAHVRMSDRKGPRGEKILHLEEAQSDWGQQGRDQGFAEPSQSKYEVYNRRSGNRSQPFDTQEEAQKYFETLPDSLKGQLEVRDFDTPNKPGIPRGPYVDNTQKWTDLALKRVLHEAAHGGYDKIVVTPGDEQNKRYDLSSQVKNITYFPDIGYLNAETHDGRGIDHNDVKPEDLAKHIGKEAADRILKQNPQRYEGRGRLGGEFYHELEGDGLKMGGAGMRGYYDNILPKRLQALAQQHDPQAKVNLHAHSLNAAPDSNAVRQRAITSAHNVDDIDSPTEAAWNRLAPDLQNDHMEHARREQSERDLDVGDKLAQPAPLHSLDVTPQMRDSIKGNGFNSFKRGGDVGMRQRYADGGGADNPVVSRALDLTSLAQPRSPIAQAQSTLRNITTQPTEVGKTSVKSLSDAFDKGISEHLALKPADRIANSKRAADSLGAHIGRLQTGRPVPLLSKNAKLLKSETGYGDEEPVQLPDGRGVETVGLALAPAYEEGKFTTCPNSASCKAECLGKTSGNYFKVGGGKDLSAFKGPRLNSLKKTIGMLRDPENFAVRLNDEIESAKREAAMNGNHLGIRLNVLSDLNPRIHKAIIENHPDVTFYDYTKNNTNPIAPNHHYTYSSTGVSQDGVDNPHSNWKQMRKRLDTGSNVAMAFSDREHLPEMVHDEETGKHYKVVNGDKHDFRPLDIQPRGADGVIVGLKNKKATGTTANAHVDSKGFFVKYDPGLQKTAKGTYMRGASVGLRKDGKPMLGDTLPTNRIVTIKTQRAAPPVKTNDTGGGK